MTKRKLEIQGNSSEESDGFLHKARMVTSLDDIQSVKFWKAVIAEFLGTMLLVLVACGSCIALTKDTAPTITQISLCFGLSVATIVWNIAHVSGGHINPAVTVGMFAARKISLARACFYVLFQLVGAIVGSGLLMALTPMGRQGSLGMTLVSEKINVGQAVGIEFFITFILVFTVFASCDSKRKDLNGSVPLTIGLSVTMCHLFAIQYTGSSMNTARSFGPAVLTGLWTHHWIQYTGASMNTARSLGPALIKGHWDDHYVYWIGPLLGGIVAGLLYENTFAANSSWAKTRACFLASDYDDDKYQAHKLKIRVIEEAEDVSEDNTNDDHNDNKIEMRHLRNSVR